LDYCAIWSTVIAEAGICDVRSTRIGGKQIDAQIATRVRLAEEQNAAGTKTAAAAPGPRQEAKAQ
jgi:hypothetical protein